MTVTTARLRKITAALIKPTANPLHKEECKRLENSLYAFLKAGWPQVEGNKPFVDMWHVEALCEHLEAVYRGEIKKLLISIPPRTSKTTTISIMWPAWIWTHAPSLQFLFVSYGQKLSWESSRLCKLLIESKWYKERWGHKVRLSHDQATKGHFVNTALGFRMASSVGAVATGFGGSIIICDDPNSLDEPQATREGTNEWISRVLPSRTNPGTLGAQVLVQQRTHEMDVSGHVLSMDENKEWVKLVLPMEFEAVTKCRTVVLPSTNGKIWEDIRGVEGELLCPNYLTEKDIKQRKIELGSYNYACQYQQRPSPAEGGIIKKQWWQIWPDTSPPKLDYVIQSWDTAFTVTDTSAYSACTSWGVFKIKEVSNLILLSAWRGKVNFPDLLERAYRLSKNYSDTGVDKKPVSKTMIPDYIIIEAKASGYSLISEFLTKGIPVHAFKPDIYGDKMVRVHKITPYIENGLTWVAGLPPDFKRLRPEHDMVVEQCAIFPNAESRDIVDSVTQAMLCIIREKGMLKHSMDFGFRDVIIPEQYQPGRKNEKDRPKGSGFINV